MVDPRDIKGPSEPVPVASGEPVGLGPDVVYYWDGGREIGVWRPASPMGPECYLSGKPPTLAQLRDQIERGGRVAKLGRRRIGPPDTPPTATDFDRLPQNR